MSTSMLIYPRAIQKLSLANRIYFELQTLFLAMSAILVPISNDNIVIGHKCFTFTFFGQILLMDGFAMYVYAIISISTG